MRIGFVRNEGDLQSPLHMDEEYAKELLRHGLVIAQEREDKLQLELQNAKDEAGEWERRALHFQRKFQEHDDALEAEETKTNDARLAKEEVEETVRRQRSEIRKAKRNEVIANEHCDAAETENTRLKKELSTEVLVTVALREDLKQTEMNEMAAYDRLDAVKADKCVLQKHLGTAINRISMLELEAEKREEGFQEERERLIEAEEALVALAEEVRKNDLMLSDSDQWETDYPRKVEDARYTLAKSMTVPTFGTEIESCDGQVHVDIANVGGPRSEFEVEQVFQTNKDLEKGIAVNNLLSAAKDRAADLRGMPTLPERAMIRPLHASLTAFPVESIRGRERLHTTPNANSRQMWRKYPWKFPLRSLQVLFQGAGRR